MKLHSVLMLAVVAAPTLGAAAIFDVTGQTSAQLETGDSLAFEILSESFARNAASFGLSPYPAEVSFAFVSSPAFDAGSFSGVIGSVDGTASVAFGGPLVFSAGSLSSASYGGVVATLQGYLHLSPLLSQELFSGGSVILTLRNNGPQITVGLDPYTLRQSLYFSAAGGSLSVGETVATVGLESAGGANGAPANGLTNLETLAATPEPESSALFLAGGGLLCGLSFGLTRLSGRLKYGETARKINRLQSPNPV